VNRVVALLFKPRHCLRGDPHIGQKFHAVASIFSSVSHAAYWRAC
jgi:hypothetical protein